MAKPKIALIGGGNIGGVLAEQAHARSRAALRGPRRDADGFRRLGHLVP